MSYDTYLVIDAGGQYPATVYEAGNMTSNVSGMWADALGKPLREFEGMPGLDLIPILETAIQKMQNPANLGHYKAMEPGNKWGSLEGATKYLQDILAGCRDYPKALLHIKCMRG